MAAAASCLAQSTAVTENWTPYLRAWRMACVAAAGPSARTHWIRRTAGAHVRWHSTTILTLRSSRHTQTWYVTWSQMNTALVCPCSKVARVSLAALCAMTVILPPVSRRAAWRSCAQVLQVRKGGSAYTTDGVASGRGGCRICVQHSFRSDAHRRLRS